MDQILPFVSDIGFLIIVTLYLLHRIETKLDTLNETLVELPERLREGIRSQVKDKRGASWVIASMRLFLLKWKSFNRF
ncbi:YvrJ family protein [[Brevibacterium] frigoritolerans]|uniref:YvrJ family protein n=1 Tax=Peribacillus frigoritolerans TaxID=450367 RepID=A0A941FI79_9BACI|nr:YvrJ family protein [Peribacillus frigoritolerans]